MIVKAKLLGYKITLKKYQKVTNSHRIYKYFVIQWCAAMKVNCSIIPKKKMSISVAYQQKPLWKSYAKKLDLLIQNLVISLNLENKLLNNIVAAYLRLKYYTYNYSMFWWWWREREERKCDEWYFSHLKIFLLYLKKKISLEIWKISNFRIYSW